MMLFRIGEVAQQTGVSEHALRQWSKRYNIQASHKSEGGQRLYTEDDIRRLNLIQTGKQRGMLLGDLARLSTSTLSIMLEQDGPDLFFAYHGDEARRYRAHYPSLRWVDLRHAQLNSNGVLIYTCETVTEEVITEVETLACRVELFAQFISRPHHRRLESSKQCTVHREKMTDVWFSKLVEQASGHTVYSQEDLNTFIETMPIMECECPNHIATILKKLRNFAEYSLECEVSSLEQAWVHKRVFDHIQKAQIEVEEALKLVVHEEDIHGQSSPESMQTSVKAG